MHSDCYFFTGKSHNICEDYSRCGQTDEIVYAIVSDGCSSSEHTDIGARILVCAAENNITTNSLGSVFNSIINNADAICNLFPGVDKTCLDATLLTAISDGALTHIKVIGDGLIVLIDINDNVEIFDIEYPSGAPRYLSYSLDPIREKEYFEKFGTNVIVKHHFGDHTSEIKFVDSAAYIKTINNKDYKIVLLMSDGIKSFYKKEITNNSKGNIPVTYKDVIKELISFKGYYGEFIKRRTKRFIKDIVKYEWENYDDVSIAGIYLV